MIDVGYKNFIDETRIEEITDLTTSKAKWARKEAIACNYLIDCTQGRKTNSVIVLKTGHVVLSSLKTSSIARRKNAMLKSGQKAEVTEKPVNQQILDALDKSLSK
ncbi:MAG TPA: DUF370 domain-containing protein [Spirochaetota bacterium]|jgi:hypothetical protein|nr:MAG: hypothetical protein BWX91_00532 [Spirochaetes bacterium ADurb.Bin133]HNZ26487.1 DUF370 domain-containing protein [Spirochaetota bacterium]HOE99862.1 DUF370 domain-containing protein [Spirochaetota bacterium]HOS31782.1 DUF370 domain-containing protein [Spirochaetota bacterium]HOS55184.1 DUF370 domain-containing protein [Spirochaetota bacterium]